MIVLASTSPRRIEIMGWLGLPFEKINPQVDESVIRDPSPIILTQKLAEAKANAVSKNLKEGAIVIGSDSVVELDGEILEKPKDKECQRAMLMKQRGKTAKVITSVCVFNTDTKKYETKTKETQFVMANVTDEQIEKYIETGVGLGKAGGYGLQDENGIFLGSEIDCFPNAIGFPICLVKEMLASQGIVIEADLQKTAKEKYRKSC